MPFMTLQLIAEPINPREERLESLIEHRLGNRVRDLRVVVRPGDVLLELDYASDLLRPATALDWLDCFATTLGVMPYGRTHINCAAR